MSNTSDNPPRSDGPRLTVPRGPIPVTGAWKPGDPAGHRQFLVEADDHPFALEGGGRLSNITIAFETWGDLDAAATNAVLVCHALTGDSHAAGPSGPGHPTDGWWDPLIGPGRALDTDRLFVVCANVLGGCQGTTGPASVNPDTGRPYGSSFPVVTIRDIVRTQARLADHLGVERWLAVVGGSMGGMQALEWGVMFPDRMRAIVPIATTVAASAWQIAYSSAGRRAIATDPKWRGGDYYDAAPGDGPHEGLGVARALAQITYRSDPVFQHRFGRELSRPLGTFDLWEDFEVERYLRYHGEKLARRYDANSYLIVNKAMDLHDLGRGRGGVHRALERIRVPVLTMSISSDTLYPPHQQLDLCDGLRAAGGECDHVMVDSPQGHDGFLLETDEIGGAVADFLTAVEKRDA